MPPFDRSPFARPRLPLRLHLPLLLRLPLLGVALLLIAALVGSIGRPAARAAEPSPARYGVVPGAAAARHARDLADLRADLSPAPAPPGRAARPPVIRTPAQARAVGRSMMRRYWPAAQWRYLDALWTRESGWVHRAVNADSGAYGIPQALPADRLRAAGRDWRTDARTQIAWGLDYIAHRYGSPAAAWAHETAFGWY